MGRPCRRASQRPLAGAHHVHDRPLHRCTPAQPALSAGHRARLLLQAVPPGQPERLAGGTAHLLRPRGTGALRRGAGHHHRGRMVRAVLRQHAGHAVQHRRIHLHHTARSRRAVGRLRDAERPPALLARLREELAAAEHCLPAGRGHARHTLLRLWLDGSRHRRSGAGAALAGAQPPRSHRQRQGQEGLGAGTLQEHGAALHADAHDRLQHVCRHRHTLIGQSPHGSELARGHLHPRRLSRTRPVRPAAPALRTGLHLAGGPRQGGRLLPSAHDHRQARVAAQGESHRRREGQLLRRAHQGRVRLRAEHVLPTHLEQQPCQLLRELDGRRHQRHQRALRPLRRDRHGEGALAAGEPQLLHLLSVQLDVLALLPLELRRPAERHTGTRRARARQLAHRLRLHRQRPTGQPVAAARRPEGEQGPQRVLLHAAAPRTHRTALAVDALRTARREAVLGRLLPLLHDRTGHRHLSEPDTHAAA